MVLTFVFCYVFFYFSVYDSATTETYLYLHTLSLHNALPICPPRAVSEVRRLGRHITPASQISPSVSKASWRGCVLSVTNLPFESTTGTPFASSRGSRWPISISSSPTPPSSAPVRPTGTVPWAPPQFPSNSWGTWSPSPPSY